MAENKTKPTSIPVREFLENISNVQKKADSIRLTEIMQELTGSEPRMWGDSIVGFGDYHYKYASGREGDWFLCGFSPRNQSLSIYVMDYLENHKDILSKLGKHKKGKGCLYVYKLSDVDEQVLRELIATSIDRLQKPG